MPHDHNHDDKNADDKAAEFPFSVAPMSLDSLSKKDPLADAIKSIADFAPKAGGLKNSSVSPETHFDGAKTCGHDHTSDPPENRISELIASGINDNFRNWVKKNNTNIAIPATAAYLCASLLNKDPYIATALTLAAPLMMNDVVENFMNAARRLEKKEIISRQTTAAIGTFMHAGSEIYSAGVNAVKGYAGADTARALAINLTSTFTSQVSHLGTMFFGAAALGRMGFANKEEWRAHATGIAGLTAGLGVPVIADAGVQAISNSSVQTASNVVSRGAGAVVSYKSATWYMGKLDEFGNACIAHGSSCSGNHDEHKFHVNEGCELSKLKDAAPPSAEKERLLTKFARSVKALPKSTKDLVQAISHRMTDIPANVSAKLVSGYRTGKRILADPAGRDAGKSVATMGALSWGMLYNIDVLAQGFALTTSAKGALHGFGHSMPETIFIFKAALKGDRKMAIGAFGGCMASMGVLGGVLLASGADIGESLRGTLMMSSYLAPPAAALLFSHEYFMKQAGKIDDAASQWVKRNFSDRFKGVSNWLSNDGTSVARWVAVPATAAALVATIAMSSQTCHTHLDGSVDCGNNLPSVVTLE